MNSKKKKHLNAHRDRFKPDKFTAFGSPVPGVYRNIRNTIYSVLLFNGRFPVYAPGELAESL